MEDEDMKFIKKFEKDYQDANTTRLVVFLGIPLLLFVVMFAIIIWR